MDVVSLEHPPSDIALVGRALAKLFDGRGFVAERFEELVGELLGVERLLEEIGYGLFDFNGVQFNALPNEYLAVIVC